MENKIIETGVKIIPIIRTVPSKIPPKAFPQISVKFIHIPPETQKVNKNKIKKKK